MCMPEVITSDDAASGAGCTLLQIFVKCTSHGEAAAYEVAIRDLVYRQPPERTRKGHHGRRKRKCALHHLVALGYVSLLKDSVRQCKNSLFSPSLETVRGRRYKIKQDAVQPAFWLDLSKKGDIALCKRKLLKGALRGDTHGYWRVGAA